MTDQHPTAAQPGDPQDDPEAVDRSTVARSTFQDDFADVPSSPDDKHGTAHEAPSGRSVSAG